MRGPETVVSGEGATQVRGPETVVLGEGARDSGTQNCKEGEG